VNLLTQTQDLSSKASQVFDSVYRSIGGSGSSPDIASFRKTVESADPKQIETAWHDQVWNNLLQPLIKNGGGPLPSTVQEQVTILADAMHRNFASASMGART